MLVNKGLSVCLADYGQCYMELSVVTENSAQTKLNINTVLFQWAKIPGTLSGTAGSRCSMDRQNLFFFSDLHSSSIFLWIDFFFKQVFSSQCQNGWQWPQTYILTAPSSTKRGLLFHDNFCCIEFLTTHMSIVYWYNWYDHHVTGNCTYLECTIWCILT